VLAQFAEHIENHFPELQKSPFLLACSGGVDSVVLAYLCQTLNLDFSIAHCNFQLRGNDSLEDEHFVGSLAKGLKKKFYVVHFDTLGHINQNKLSLQVAARELRYAWFSELMKEKGYRTLVTAHHGDDNLETFLINLSRGTGIEGLTGIPEKTESISRPLLKFSKETILAYAKQEKLEWREDRTNAETKYLRNKIRHDIVPHLKELHPTFPENFHLTQSHLSETAAMVKNHITALKKEIFHQKEGFIEIGIADLGQLHPLKAYLYQLFSDYGFTAWNDIAHLIDTISGKAVYSKTHRLIRSRDALLLELLRDPDSNTYTIAWGQTEIRQPVPLILQEVKAMGDLDKNVLYADKKTLKYPLTVRKWKKGDYFHPFGMKGSKKLSKFFKDEKYDAISKERQWLLCSDNKVVWVIGKRADERFKVTKNTSHIVKITLNR
jgi:tRNA(Ile)-lysidine synthase